MKNKSINPSYQIDATLRVFAPEEQTTPTIFSSPHSGRHYIKPFTDLSPLSKTSLRQSEDAFVDEIFSNAPLFGASLLVALFPRAFVDPNRKAWELDPKMFSDVLPPNVITRSPYIRAGLGTIPRVVADGKQIYREKLRFSDAKTRIIDFYIPYHKTLKELITKTFNRFNCCLLIDCHSMPSNSGRGEIATPDIILGDNNGQSCSSEIVELVEKACLNEGFTVARNNPYSGGFTTQNYGRPETGIHTLQIEVNRAIYMNEETIKRLPSINSLKSKISNIIETVTQIQSSIMRPNTNKKLDAAE